MVEELVVIDSAERLRERGREAIKRKWAEHSITRLEDATVCAVCGDIGWAVDRHAQRIAAEAVYDEWAAHITEGLDEAARALIGSGQTFVKAEAPERVLVVLTALGLPSPEPGA